MRAFDVHDGARRALLRAFSPSVIHRERARARYTTPDRGAWGAVRAPLDVPSMYLGRVTESDARLVRCLSSVLSQVVVGDMQPLRPSRAV
jgi:hypothetical protein